MPQPQVNGDEQIAFFSRPLIKDAHSIPSKKKKKKNKNEKKYNCTKHKEKNKQEDK